MKKLVLFFVFLCMGLTACDVSCTETPQELYVWSLEYERSAGYDDSVYVGFMGFNNPDDVEQAISNLKDLETPRCMAKVKLITIKALKEYKLAIEMFNDPTVSDVKAKEQLESAMDLFHKASEIIEQKKNR